MSPAEHPACSRARERDDDIVRLRSSRSMRSERRDVLNGTCDFLSVIFKWTLFLAGELQAFLV